ncbi:MAG: GNAT family N-acetyltransferase [Melioribacteraceae bacterium]|nr:GNAT family N-acetyltransferase [Melioribacteraceae bacterium]MCO6472236.1 GNAT family N-acetyltransferase [Melioribacteraceae bacterium]MDD3558425.1 GNAT family N-acetyltransferase [Melioribacteraceae bacterium]
MLTIKRINNENEFDENVDREKLVDFLFKHLDQFGDPKEQINKCIDYAFSKSEGKGGFLLAGLLDDELVGAVIMNKTGMIGYIPENILVYVAVDASKRGQGIGKQLVEKAIEESKGNVKLHVEYDNPAKRLYERIGFTNKYAEMRYIK